MNLKDPVPAYSGADPAGVHILRNLLVEAGIEAFVPEDVDTSWTGGSLPGIRTPQVFVERADLERAKPILEDYERLVTERVEADLDADTKVAAIEVTCDKCHKASAYPHSQIGSVQSCPVCGAFVDVNPDEQRAMTGDPQ